MGNDLTLSDYQRNAATTAGGERRTDRAFLGLAGEAGEVCEVRKKHLRGDFDGDEYRRRLTAELGDVLWYLAECCTVHDLALDVVGTQNLRKLLDRSERAKIQGDGDDR